ncbi:MAG: PAS domain-containing protein, partial [Bacillota bacterium]
MNSLIALSADYYWEQDQDGRFTRIESTTPRAAIPPADLRQIAGRAGWDVAAPAAEPDDWTRLWNAIAQRASFRNLELSWHTPSAGTRVLSVTGEPRFEHGCFVGYRGIMRDLTEQRRREDALRRFRAALDASGDPIFLIDRETMRIIDANDIACSASGYSREELLTLGPPDFLLSDRDEIERDF